MSKWAVPAFAAEVVLVTGLIALLVGVLGDSAAVATVTGGVLMTAIGIPGVALVLWGRGKSNTAFMTSVLGTILCKFAVVGVAVLWVVLRTELPPLGFVGGLLVGWLASLGLLALGLRRADRAATAHGSA